MSTRCNIIVKGPKCKCNQYVNSITLYHHHDGYPSGVGVNLKEYIDYLNSGYKYCHWDQIANQLVRKGLTFVNEKGEEHYDNEYEIAAGLSGDIEYLYIIDADPYPKEETDQPRYRLTCYAIDRRWDEEKKQYTDAYKELVEIPDYHNDPYRLKK